MIITYGFWGLVIAALILVIRRLVHTGKAGSADSNEIYPAVEILKKSYQKEKSLNKNSAGSRMTCIELQFEGGGLSAGRALSEFVRG